MKKILAFSFLLTILAAVGRAAWVYNAYLVNNPALAYSNNYTINLNAVPNAAGIAHLSAQAVYSSATFAAATFNDGQVSTTSITVAHTANLLSAAATNQITVAATSSILAASATNFITVLTTSSLTGKTITYNGNPLIGGTNWTIVSTTSGTAQNITNAINHFAGITATRSANVVTLTAPAGASGNNKTLAVNTSSITIGGSTFGGGHNNRLAGAYITANGHKYYQGGPWVVADTSSGTATSIAAFLNRLSGIKASAAASVVYATATVNGTAGNAFTLASSAPSYMTATSANFTGGRNNANVCVNGTCVTQGTNWTAAATSSGTARAISNALVANSTIGAIVRSTWSASGVVTATSTAVGSNVNYAITTNDSTDLTLLGATMTGGSASAVALTTVIHIPSHGYGTALGVVFSTGSGTGLSPLVTGTTYYVGVIGANDIALSTTAARAIAGQYVTLTSSTTTGPNNFTLTPQSYSGTPGLAWYSSNDGVNYNPINISSATISTGGTASQAWDFGRLTAKYIQLQVVGPTQGALNLAVNVNGSN